MLKQHNKKIGTQGFTLVELSIVIIIIGFLIAGIAAGTSLIKQAELNSVVRDFQSYQTAYNNFLGRYSKAPGDFNGAVAIWTQTNIRTTTSGNGDGNGIIDTVDESWMAWKHLSLANMISSGIAVVPASVAVAPTIGTNVPASKVTGAGYMMVQGDTAVTGLAFTEGDANLWSDGRTNAVFLAAGPDATGFLLGGALKAEDAFNIDKKLDDGQISGANFVGANTGSIRTVGSNAGTCLVTSTLSQYSVSSTTSDCVVGIALN
jgi:prepilin-type N-terminal cleavage/methylation domain-containing protein